MVRNIEPFKLFNLMWCCSTSDKLQLMFAFCHLCTFSFALYQISTLTLTAAAKMGGIETSEHLRKFSIGSFTFLLTFTYIGYFTFKCHIIFAWTRRNFFFWMKCVCKMHLCTFAHAGFIRSGKVWGKSRRKLSLHSR